MERGSGEERCGAEEPRGVYKRLLWFLSFCHFTVYGMLVRRFLRTWSREPACRLPASGSKGALKAGVVTVIAFICGLVIGISWLTAPRFEEINISSSDGESPQKGLKAPDFALPSTEDGKEIKLSEYKGRKFVLLYFWATWCPSCLEARGELEKLRKVIDYDDLEVIAVNVGVNDSLDRVKSFEKKHPLSVLSVYDGNGKVSSTYGVRGVPLFVLIDKEGVVVWREHEIPVDMIKHMVSKEVNR